jgi:putative flippase GtrA
MGAQIWELARYVVNGFAATLVHFGVLTFNIEVLGLRSAGVANGIAAIFGITASFLGNRYFVFPGARAALSTLVLKFGGLYGAIALMHALVLALWTDWLGLDYRIGFLLATGLQASLSYLGNKFLVFRR